MQEPLDMSFNNEKVDLKKPSQKTWVNESLLLAIISPLPFGIMASFYALKAQYAIKKRDMLTAHEAAKAAKKWLIIGSIATVIMFIIAIIYVYTPIEPIEPIELIEPIEIE